MASTRSRDYAFAARCVELGFPDVQACPIPFSFVTAVNISVVWVFGPPTALLGRRRPELALAFFSVPIINAIPHIVRAWLRAPTMRAWDGDRDLRTLSLWVSTSPLSLPAGLRAVIATIVAGIVYHAIMIGSAAVFVAGRMGVLVLDAIQVINPILILLIVGRLGRKRPARVISDNSGINRSNSQRPHPEEAAKRPSRRWEPVCCCPPSRRGPTGRSSGEVISSSPERR